MRTLSIVLYGPEERVRFHAERLATDLPKAARVSTLRRSFGEGIAHAILENPERIDGRIDYVADFRNGSRGRSPADEHRRHGLPVYAVEDLYSENAAYAHLRHDMRKYIG